MWMRKGKVAGVTPPGRLGLPAALKEGYGYSNFYSGGKIHIGNKARIKGAMLPIKWTGRLKQ